MSNNPDETTDKIMELLTPDPWGQAASKTETPREFLDKRQSLAMFLLAMATGLTWEDAEGVDDYHDNYTKDADEILRQHPHLLSLTTREQMGIPT